MASILRTDGRGVHSSIGGQHGEPASIVDRRGVRGSIALIADGRGVASMDSR